MTRESEAASSARLVAAACLTNMAMGVLYVWSLFLLPMEEALRVSRSVLSFAPTIALVSFTLGMYLHDRILRAVGFRGFAFLAFGAAGIGHLLFAFIGGLAALLIGYGVIFGFGAGLGYGLALALVIRVPERQRSLGIGLVMAAFAVSGMTLSSLLAGPIREAEPHESFFALGGAVLALGLIVVAMMPRLQARGQGTTAPQASSLTHDFTERRFVTIFTVFFSLCFSGLLVVSHATGIVAAQGADQWLTGVTPGAFTVGYILGSFFLGKAVEAWSGRTMLLASNVLAATGLVLFMLPASPMVLLAAGAVGIVFGGTASLMPVLIAEQFGAARVGEIYGKLMLAYGLAGLIAPSLSGRIFASTGGYGGALALAIGLALLGLLLGVTLRRSARGLPVL